MCDFDDYPEEIASEWRRARKEHRCFACQETILAGHRYHFVAQIYDGAFSAIKHCARCWAIMSAILNAGAESVQWDLNCGESWESNFGVLPDAVAALAFMTPNEAQQLLETDL